MATRYFKYNLIDSKTKNSVRTHQSFNSKIKPEVPGLTELFKPLEQESENYDIYYGSSDQADNLDLVNKPNVPGIIREYSEEEYNKVLEQEFKTRQNDLQNRRKASWMKKLSAGRKFKDVLIKTDVETSMPLISNTVQAVTSAKLFGRTFGNIVWTGKDFSGKDVDVVFTPDEFVEFHHEIFQYNELLYEANKKIKARIASIQSPNLKELAQVTFTEFAEV